MAMRTLEEIKDVKGGKLTAGMSLETNALLATLIEEQRETNRLLTILAER
ncbi:hypothetical protein [Cellulomonas sp. Leaf395]|nr:hypothetical protein [Cellulomonas sp. Leaf395]